jgi:undecaprenyl diphosphate synthase
MGIKALTLYSFSLENWSRPRDEVNALMEILAEYLERELSRMLEEGIRFNTIGHVEDLPIFAQEWVNRAMTETADREGMILTLALSYSSRREIADAAQALAREALAGKISPEEIDESDIERNLYTSDLPELDLLIRTSGELRLSNYLLWQAAYAEMYFTNLYWPNFGERELEAAVLAFQSRVRKFGLTEDQIASPKV